ncbi:helix-turn-helix domain-containing protein [Streptomyces sp. NPDC007905]|uniref:PucR family transcriptional regulator n=1 Tax=Streptomyces sp. NPDC007905 TaxID=3364788 RepID=UPI0036E473A8
MPSDRIRELIRRGAAVAARSPEEWLREVEDATLSAEYLQALTDDPELTAQIRRTSRANVLHWATWNVRSPGAPVPANVGPEALATARELVRRGLNDSALQSYRSGQNAAWLRWMSIAFELTSDPTELRELLDVSSRSISAFVDATVAAVSAQMQAERDQLTRGTNAERREVVTLLVNGAPIHPDRASARLGYQLEQTHTAAVVWSDAAELDLGDLERAVDALAKDADVARFLTVTVSAAMLWVWLPSATPPTTNRLAQHLDSHPTARAALGSTGHGVEGFRRSHLNAMTTQRMMARLHTVRPVARFETVEIVALVTQEPQQADQFVRRALGGLATAAPELREAVAAYIHEECNATRAAARLFTHRNTLLRRLERAQHLLPHPLAGNTVRIAVALDVLHWRGDG